MRGCEAIIAANLLLSLCVPAWSAAQKDYDDCDQTSDSERAMSACTRLIDDQSELVTDRVFAYLKRGNLYAASDKPDNAIADYSEAIKLDPQNVLAYSSRAIAYFRKNERGLAAADYRHAEEVDPAKLREISAASNELRQVASTAEAERPAAAFPPITTRVTVEARKSWQAAGLSVHGHGALIFAASGAWIFNPSLPAVSGAGDSRFSTHGRPAYAFSGPNGREGQLIGRIGHGAPFVVGTSSRHKVADYESGPVYLVINDDLEGVAGKGLTDNLGHLKVTVRESE